MKRSIYLVVIFLLLIGKLASQPVWDGTTEAFTGTGSIADPYKIETPMQLAKIAEMVASGEENFVDNYIVLVADLDLGGASTTPQKWKPIGTKTLAFGGNLDGQGHTVSNLYISGESDYVGLFGRVGGSTSADISAVIKNLGIVGNSSISGGDYVGGLSGYIASRSTIENCYNTGAVSGNTYVGGLVGYTENVIIAISKCFNLGNVTGTVEFTGGIAGHISSQIRDCYNMGRIVGVNSVGGIAGYTHSAIDNCYSAGDVLCNGINGGIIAGNTSRGESSSRGCYGDIQMCSQTMFTGNLGDGKIELAKGMITSAMTNGVVFERVPNSHNPDLTWSTDVWGFTVGMYPRLKATKDLAIVKLYATPVLFNVVDNISFESLNNVKTNFTVNTSNGVVWTSDKTSLVNISGTNATVVCPAGIPDNVNIIATSNGLTKKIALRILPQPFTLTINNPANGNITVMDGNTVVKNGDKIDYGKTLRIFAETNDGFMLERFVVDGVNTTGSEVLVKKDVTVSAIVVQTTVTTWDGTSSVVFGEGFGTEEKPYVIYTPQQLSLLSKNVLAGNDYAGVYFKLANDIDLGGAESTPYKWNPIGANVAGKTYSFKGSFDGSGKYFSNIYINDPLTMYVGLFGYLNDGGELKNINLRNGYINGSSYVGGITGYNRLGTVRSCLNAGNINGAGNIGGIVGYNDGTVDGCVNLGNVLGASNNVGGVVGNNSMANGMLKNSYNSGNVKTTGRYLGGVVGRCDGKISNCYSSGSVEGGSGNVGGVAGNSLVSFDKCFFDKQMCVQTQAISGYADSDKAKGLVTSEMTSAALDNSDDLWVFEDGMYPRLKSIINDLTKLYASPIVLQTIGEDEDMVFEAYNAIKNNFNVKSGDGIVWTSGSAAIVISGGDAIVDRSKSENNDITLTATLNGNTRNATVIVYPLEVIVKIAEVDNGSLTVMFEKTVLGDETSIPIYNTLIFKAIPNDGYTLGAFMVNGEEIEGNTLLLTDESVISAKFVNVDDVEAWDGTTASFFGGGEGTVAVPYLIHTAEQLAYLSSKVNAGEIFSGKHFKIMNNIDLAGNASSPKKWIPIGNSTNKFAGVVNGNGKLIMNLNVDRADIDNVGLFGCTGFGFEVTKLGIGGESTVKGKNNVGAMVGFNEGRVTVCFSKANVTGGENVGGVIGNCNKGNVADCYNKGTVVGTKFVGGIMGSSNASLANSYNVGNVIGTSYTGAITGVKGSGSYINNSYYDNIKLTIKAIGNETGSTDNEATNAIGKTTVEMTDGTFATILGKSTPNPWREDFSANSINDKYPVLTWEIVKLTVGSIANGTITINGTTREDGYTEDIQVGSVLDLKAIQSEGYNFVSWWDGNTNAERKYTVIENVEISALFMKGIAVTVIVPENGSIKLEYNNQETIVTDSEDADVVIDVVVGSDLKMTAIANEGFHFLNWNDNESSVNPYTVKIIEEREVRVVFDSNSSEYEVVVTNPEVSMGNISVTKDGVAITSGDKFVYGTTLKLTANGIGEYQFIKWWDNSTESERELTVERNVEITALFEIVTHVVTIDTPDNGVITVSNESTVINSGDSVKDGSVLTLSNIPNTGYNFKGYSVNGKAIEGNSVTVTKNMTITAKFEGVKCKVNVILPDNCYALVVMNGSDVVVDGTMISSGTVLTLSSSMPIGYRIGSYTANGETFSGSTITVTSDVILSANVERRTYKINIYQPDGGSVTVKNGDIEVNNGDHVPFKTILTLYETTNAGYTFEYFTVGGYRIDGSEIEVKGAIEISGRYEISSYKVTLPTVEGAIIAAVIGYDAERVTHGSDFKFKVTLKAEYSDSQITVKVGSEELSSVGGTYTISNVTENKRVTVSGVIKNEFAITIVQASNGTFTVKKGAVVVNSGDKVEAGVILKLEAQPDSGYEIDYFTVDGYQIYGTELIVSESITISVVFRPCDGVEDADELKARVYSYGKSVYVTSTINANATVYDISGKLILTSDVAENVKTEFEISQIGTYIVRLVSNNKTSVTKIVIN